MTLSEKVVEKPEEASSTFQFWTDLAHRMGLSEHFPWKSLDDILDYRLSRSGRSFAEFAAETTMESPPAEHKKYQTRGFATPSGKVELYSSILDELGFDPLPYYREGPATSAEYPYLVFTGVREDSFFQTGQRNIEVLRKRSPLPRLFLHPDDAAQEGIEDGAWAQLETPYGKVTAQISVQESMKPGHVRVPHGWWYPELRGQDDLAGAFLSSDAVLCSDEPEFLDLEQGVPHFKGFPGRVRQAEAPPSLASSVSRRAP